MNVACNCGFNLTIGVIGVEAKIIGHNVISSWFDELTEDRITHLLSAFCIIDFSVLFSDNVQCIE